MKKLLLSAVLLQTLNFVNAQQSPVVLLEDSFESYTDFAITGIGNWQTLDLDGLPTYYGGVQQGQGWTNAGAAQAYIVFNPTAAGATNATNPPQNENRNFDPHTGEKYMAAWAAVPPNTNPRGNEDWLISPAINLGTSGNQLSFWVKALSDSYGNENYKVGVYVGSGTPTSSNDFTIISGATPLEATYPDWEQKMFSLDNYAGQTVRLGIQYVSQDVYMFMVDDVLVTTAQQSTSELTKNDGIAIENPTTGLIKIVTDKKIGYAKVYDASGKLVTDKLQDRTIDITSSPAGVYYVNILTADHKVVTKKVIKK